MEKLLLLNELKLFIEFGLDKNEIFKIPLSSVSFVLF